MNRMQAHSNLGTCRRSDKVRTYTNLLLYERLIYIHFEAIWRFMLVFDAHEFKLTVFVNADG
jgi:hypothetical protein